MYGVCVHAVVHLWMPEDSFREPVLFCSVGPVHRPQLVRLGSRHFYPLNHPAGPADLCLQTRGAALLTVDPVKGQKKILFFYSGEAKTQRSCKVLLNRLMALVPLLQTQVHSLVDLVYK